MSSDGALLRVCHLIAPGPMAGAEKVVLCGCDVLLQHGLDVTLTVIRDQRGPEHAEIFYEEAKTRRIPATSLSTSGRVDFRLWKELRQFLIKGQYQVLHTHGYKAFLYGLAARPKELCVVHTHHGDTSRGWVMRLYQRLTYHRMKCADGIFAVSEAMYASLHEHVCSGRLHLVENMLVLPHLVTESARRERQSSEPLKLVAVGRLSPEKGLHVLLSALAQLPSSSMELTFVGQGSEEASLRELTERLGIGQSVTFVGFQSDVVPYLAEADALVMPSFREGLPLTLIEAAAIGLPVVATKVGGIPSIVNHRENGILCEANNVDSMAAALQAFIDDADRLKATALARAAEIQERFSPRTWATRTIAVYRKTIGMENSG